LLAGDGCGVYAAPLPEIVDREVNAGAVMLTGADGVLRVRTGAYRILYTVDDDRRVVSVVDAGHRRDICQR
jgi:mRNA-degrading endonuclease RelE of RelBE toxin-antitoxin system